MVFQLPTLHRGMIIPRPMFDIEDAYRTIQDKRVNTVFGPPAFYLALLNDPRFGDYDLSSPGFVCAAAAPFPPSLLKAMAEQDQLCSGSRVGYD